MKETEKMRIKHFNDYVAEYEKEYPEGKVCLPFKSLQIFSEFCLDNKIDLEKQGLFEISKRISDALSQYCEEEREEFRKQFDYCCRYHYNLYFKEQL
ncbi:MAG: hypothetical protein IK990_02305 [Ruminiclostridium sp.]|nr:hypothetical protein [Ruminiclostridium sp.]